MTTWLMRAILVLTLLIASAGTVLAGGWATVRLDSEPGPVREGEAWRFGFIVKQHDRTPINNVQPVVQAVHMATGETVTAEAEQVGPVGHFEAELVLPSAGGWKWSIKPEPFEATSLETLTVLAAGDEATASTRPIPSLFVPLPGGGWRIAVTFDIEPLPDVAEAPEPVEITITDAGFSPARVEIARGTEVVWINQSSVAHGVMSDNLSFRDSSLLDNNGEYRQLFAEEGTFSYWCGPHPFMTGTIVVTGDEVARGQ